MKISSERLVDSKYDMVVQLQTIDAWEAPFRQVPVTDSDKRRIEQHVREALSKYSVLWEQ